MKKVLYFAITALCAAAFAVSCQKASEISAPDQNSNLVTLKCEFPSIQTGDTKVALDGNKKTVWQEGDQIVFQGGPVEEHMGDPVVYTLKASDIDSKNPGVATVSVDLSSLVPDEGTPHAINAAYPASVWSSYSSSHMYGRSRFTDATNKLLMAGYVEGSSIVFTHVTGVILFKVPAALNGVVDSYVFKGNNDEVLGYGKYLVEMNSNDPDFLKKLGAETYGTLDPVKELTGTVTADGSTVHAVHIQNTANFTGGFSIYFKSGSDVKKVISTSTPLNLVHGHGVDLGVLSADKIHDYVAPSTSDHTYDSSVFTSVTDLGEGGTANSYIISTPGSYKLPVVKGNSSTSAGNVFGVQLLWETWNNTETVTANSVIAAVDFDGPSNYVYFKTPATLKPGNALIAAKNNTGEIIWSWHIWVPETAISDITEANFSASRKVMSRNLGALVDTPADAEAPVASFGLLYEWGRKDPFPGLGSLTSATTPITVAGTAMTQKEGPSSIEAAIANPTVYYYVDGGCWLPESMTTDKSVGELWGEEVKTVYDPCPKGYVLAKRDKSCAFWSGNKWTASTDPFVLNADKYSFSVGSLVFPVAGYIDDGGEGQKKAGIRTIVWSGRWDSGTANGYGFFGDLTEGSVGFQNKGNVRSRGGSVRCVKEATE